MDIFWLNKNFWLIKSVLTFIKNYQIVSLYIIKKIENSNIGNEVTDFYDRETPKVDSKHTCLAVIGLDSALKKHEN